ncbi:MAG: radical SAM protein [Actinobacteria bacterium]|nr:radical SAM protein [Actinomycetota bacterium]
MFPKGEMLSNFMQDAKILAGIVSRRVLTGPHSVQISIVDACNYRCIMCWEHSSELNGLGADPIARDYHENKKYKKTVMDLKVFKSLITSLASSGTGHISLAGIGEPLMHKHIVEAIAFARENGIKVWLTTNGSRLNQDIMKELAACGLEDINVSINAGNAAEYSLVHSNQNNSMYDQIIDHLVWFKGYKHERGLTQPQLTLSNVVCNLNYHRSVEMMRAGIATGARNVFYRPIDVYEQTRDFALSDAHLDELRSSFAACEDLADRHGIQTNISMFEKLLALRDTQTIPAPCFAGWVAPFVLANGDVTFCCLSREVLGNLSESSFGDIWFSSSRRSLNETALRMHKTQEAVPNSRCLGCEQSFQNLKVNRFLWPLLGKSKASGTAAAMRRAV